MFRTLWAAVALLAIVAMHGLASHGAAHDPAPTTATSMTLAGGHHSADRAMAAASSAAAAAAHGEPSHDMAVLGLCAAVLATSAILLLVRLGRPRSGLMALLPRAVTTASHPVGVRAWPHPPDLHALSILRC